MYSSTLEKLSDTVNGKARRTALIIVILPAVV